MLVSLIGEILKIVIPLPIPASIYGMILMFAALAMKLIKLDAVRETGLFLVNIMPVLFVPAAVGVMTALTDIGEMAVAVLLSLTVITALVMGASGRAAQFFIRRVQNDK
jgi:holin-like protein